MSPENGVHPGAGMLYEEQDKWRESKGTAAAARAQSADATGPYTIYHVRRYLILLLLQENSWDRLPYLIYLLKDASLEEYRDKLLGALRFRSLYARVDRKQAAFIKQVLAEEADTVPQELAGDILFDLKFVS